MTTIPPASIKEEKLRLVKKKLISEIDYGFVFNLSGDLP